MTTTTVQTGWLNRVSPDSSGAMSVGHAQAAPNILHRPLLQYTFVMQLCLVLKVRQQLPQALEASRKAVAGVCK